MNMNGKTSTFTALHRACYRGDLPATKSLLHPFMDSDEDVRTKLHAYGAGGRDASKWGTPIEIAARRGHYGCADYMLARILVSHLHWLWKMRGQTPPPGHKSEDPSAWLLDLLQEAGIFSDMAFVRWWSQELPGSRTLVAALALGLPEVANGLADAIGQGLGHNKGSAPSRCLEVVKVQHAIMAFACYSRDRKTIQAALAFFEDKGQPAKSLLETGCVALLRGWPWNLHHVPACLEVHERFSEVTSQMKQETVRQSLSEAIQWSRLQTRLNVVLLLPQSLPTVATMKEGLQNVSKLFR